MADALLFPVSTTSSPSRFPRRIIYGPSDTSEEGDATPLRMGPPAGGHDAPRPAPSPLPTGITHPPRRQRGSFDHRAGPHEPHERVGAQRWWRSFFFSLSSSFSFLRLGPSVVGVTDAHLLSTAAPFVPPSAFHGGMGKETPHGTSRRGTTRICHHPLPPPLPSGSWFDMGASIPITLRQGHPTRSVAVVE